MSICGIFKRGTTLLFVLLFSLSTNASTINPTATTLEPTSVLLKIALLFALALLAIALIQLTRVNQSRKKSANRLAAQRKQFATLLNTIDEGIIISDTNDNITLMNPAAESMTECLEQLVIGKAVATIFKIYDQQTREPILPATGQNSDLEANSVAPAPALLVANNGKELYISYNIAPIHDNQGVYQGTLTTFSDTSKQRTAERELKLSEQKFATLISNLPGMAYRTRNTPEWPMDYISERSLALTGYSPEQFFPQGDIRYAKIIHPDDRDMVWNTIQQALKNASHFTIIYRIITITGECKWVWEQGVQVQVEEQNKSFIDGFITDITAVKQSEDALRNSEERFRQLADSLPEIIFETDIAGNLTFANQVAYSMAGYTAADFAKGLNGLDLIHPDDRERAKSNLAKILKGKSVGQTDYRIVKKNGESLHALFHTLPILNNGELVGSRGFVIDISNRITAEQALQDEREHLLQLFEHMTNGVAIYEPIDDANDFIFVDINKAGERIVQVRKSAILGKRLTEVLPAAVKYGLLIAMQRASETGLPQYVPFSEYSDNRISQHIENRAFRLPSGRVVTLFDDRTQQHQLEERLQQMEKMDAIGQLAGGIAHDFNNQLGVILGYADMLTEVVHDQVHSRYLNNIISCAHRSADITRKLLAFARKGKYQFTAVNVHSVIQDVAEILRHSIDKRITIKQRLNADPFFTSGDPSQLQNALLNLAINARDAMPDGGNLTFTTANIKLTEAHFGSLHFEIEPGDYIVISVIDTGVGISENFRKHIFEPFFTTKETGKGTGMGLAAVYGTIKNHKGAIDVKSVEQQGATFSIYLPLGEPEADAPISTDYSKPKALTANLLVIEDEKTVRAMLNDMLLSINCSATFCNSGEEGIEQYRQNWQSIDLVLLDMIMPGVSGAETFHLLRQINPDVTILLISGYSLDGAAQELLSQGAAGFIQKPFDKRQLLDEINRILDKKMEK